MILQIRVAFAGGTKNQWVGYPTAVYGWKIEPWKMYFLLNMGIFHCYVSLPKGTRYLPTEMILQEIEEPRSRVSQEAQVLGGRKLLLMRDDVYLLICIYVNLEVYMYNICIYNMYIYIYLYWQIAPPNAICTRLMTMLIMFMFIILIMFIMFIDPVEVCCGCNKPFGNYRFLGFHPEKNPRS